MAFDPTKPSGTDSIGASDELIRENFRALKEDKIVDAGYFQGYSPSNAAGNIPISNGTLCTNLNAEFLGGQNSSYYRNAGNINAGTIGITFLPTITAAKGGTGQTTYAIGDILYASSTSALSKLAKGTGLQQLRMNAGATAPEWYTPVSNLPLAGGTMSGAIAMGNFKITGLADPTLDQDAGTKKYIDSQVAAVQATVKPINYTPFAVNSAKQTSGSADFIAKVSDTSVNILATATPVKLTHSDGTQETISADTAISSGILNEHVNIFLKEKNNANPVVVPIADNSKDALIDFSEGNAVDKYGGTVTKIGSPTFTGNKFVSNGSTGLKLPLVTTLGAGKWTIEFKVKFNANNATYCLIIGEVDYILSISRSSANKLSLYLGSNGTSWNLANALLGTKADYDTVSEYRIRLSFTGTQYLLYVNDVLDITLNSATSVYSSTGGGIRFGISNSNATPLAGTLDDIRITVGENRTGAEPFVVDRFNIFEEYRKPLDTEGNNGDLWTDVSTVPFVQYKKASGAWSTTTPFVKLGEATKTGSVLGTPVSYALNGISVIETAGVKGSNTNLFHNLGINHKFITADIKFQPSSDSLFSGAEWIDFYSLDQDTSSTAGSKYSNGHARNETNRYSVVFINTNATFQTASNTLYEYNPVKLLGTYKRSF